jgi:hypothetical protein
MERALPAHQAVANDTTTFPARILSPAVSLLLVVVCLTSSLRCVLHAEDRALLQLRQTHRSGGALGHALEEGGHDDWREAVGG